MTRMQVSRDQWTEARKRLLEREKALTHELDKVNAERRELPVVAIEKDYHFVGRQGDVGLADLFQGRKQLIVYHMMWRWDLGAGCPSCSLLIDGIGHQAHLHAADTTLAIVSRGPWPDLERFVERMGWTLPVYSSQNSDFNYDFHATLDSAVAPVEYNFRTAPELASAGQDWMLKGSWEMPGISIFLQEDDAILHTYSAYARGGDMLISAHHWLDLTPLGRQHHIGEAKHHDRYDDSEAEGGTLEEASR